MHELSIATAVLGTAIDHSGGRSITAVELRVGALRQVVPSSLDFYFAVASEGTLAEGATLRQRPIRALLRCSCGTEWDPAPEPAAEQADLRTPPSFRCPACGSGGAELVRGEELEVASIEVLDRAFGKDWGSTAGAARPES